jgi:predicted Rossmann fold nucleotide-binding protein DprA/Smf involved in DNA uptake
MTSSTVWAVLSLRNKQACKEVFHLSLKTYLPAPFDCTAALATLARRASVSRLIALGNLDLLQSDTLALFCSAKCPGSLILEFYNALRTLREKRQTVISGFHSPLEQEALLTLMQGQGGIIICPARSIDTMRVPVVWHQALSNERLLVLSSFAAHEERISARLAARRNEFVAAIADRVLIVYAESGSRTAELARTILERGKRLLTLPAPENKHLLEIGAESL